MSNSIHFHTHSGAELLARKVGFILLLSTPWLDLFTDWSSPTKFFIALIGLVLLVLAWRSLLFHRRAVVRSGNHVYLKLENFWPVVIPIRKIDDVHMDGNFLHVIYDHRKKRQTFNVRSLGEDDVRQLLGNLQAMLPADVKLAVSDT